MQTKNLKKISNLKPIDYEISFKYKCPNCGDNHFVSSLQASVPGFILVCECQTILEIKTISKIKIKYMGESENKNTTDKSLVDEPVCESHDNDYQIPPDLLEKCISVFSGYGYTKNEAGQLLTRAYKEFKIDDCWALIKKTLETIGVKNE
jgi:predicted RNA-binding Zn-ribbon protein involved in translation (DUF1610 family)